MAAKKMTVDIDRSQGCEGRRGKREGKGVMREEGERVRGERWWYRKEREEVGG